MTEQFYPRVFLRRISRVAADVRQFSGVEARMLVWFIVEPPPQNYPQAAYCTRYVEGRRPAKMLVQPWHQQRSNQSAHIRSRIENARRQGPLFLRKPLAYRFDGSRKIRRFG